MNIAIHQHKPAHCLFALLLSALLASCGGGEGGTGIQPRQPGADVSLGTITQFGSIVVNGVHFDVNNSDISMDGMTADQLDLRLGMYATVMGTINADGVTGIADKVIIKETLRGPVSSKPTADTLEILNQLVQIPDSVHWETGITSLTDINIGDVVEISGHVNGPGEITASRVERITGGAVDSKLFGIVQSLDTTTKSFSVGSLNVDYSSAVFTGLTQQDLQNNLYLEIKGNLTAPGQLLATAIEKEQLSVQDNSEVELEGFVVASVSANEFIINNVNIAHNSATRFKGGTVDEIGIGTLLEVEGGFVNGVLIADEIEFRDPIRVEAVVESVDLVANTLVLQQLDAAPVTIKISSYTEFSSDLPNGLSDLQAGIDQVRLRGTLITGASTQLLVRRLDKRTPDNSFSIQGPVLNLPMDPLLDVMSKSLDTTGLPDTFFLVDEVAVGRTEFFSSVEQGSLVEASGSVNGGILVWDNINLID